MQSLVELALAGLPAAPGEEAVQREAPRRARRPRGGVGRSPGDLPASVPVPALPLPAPCSSVGVAPSPAVGADAPPILFCALCASGVSPGLPASSFVLRPLGKGDTAVWICLPCDGDPVRAFRGPDLPYSPGDS